MFSKSVLNKQQLNKQLNKPRPSELAVPSGEVSYKEYSGGLWQAVMWFSAAIAAGLIMGSLFFNFAEAAEGPSGKRYFQIEPKNISMALNEFAMQADSEILFTPDIVEGKQTSGLTGEFTDGEALTKILAGSGLEFKEVDEKVFLVVDPETFEGSAESYKGKSGNADKRVIEEITVTATKRETSLQDTPMSITAIGSEEIARRGLVGMGDYLSSVPGVSVLEQGAGRTQVVIRGIAGNPQNDGFWGSSTTGVYFGEIPISGLAAAGSHSDIKMVDIERVEVLRGPQGTLYGSSNLSGTVKNVPVSSNLQEFEGSFQAGLSSTGGLGGDNTEIKAVVNLPLVEGQLAVRAVAYRYDNSGYYKNIGPNDPDIAASIATYGAVSVARDDVGSDEYVGGRISALWTPTDKLSINLTYLQQDIDQDGWPSADLSLGEGFYLQRRFQIRDSAGAPNYGEPSFNEGFGDKVKIANAVVEYDIGWANILSSTSWLDEDYIFRREVGPVYFDFIPVSQPNNGSSSAFFQEIRMASQFEGPLQFVMGLYYEDIDREEHNFVLFGGDPALNPFANQIELIRNNSFYSRTQKAIFGEFSYELTEELKLTLGARKFDYDNGFRRIDEPGPFLGAGGSMIAEGEEDDVNYKAGIDYVPSEDALLYAAVSQGFRIGRTIPPNDTPLCDPDNDGFFDGSGGISTDTRQIPSDTVDNYELGGKFGLLDNRLQINIAAFQINWDGIPINVVFETGCGSTIGGGEARSRGAEFEGFYAVNDSLLLNFGVSYVQAELTADAPSLGSKGDRLPGAPKHNFNLGLQYNFAIVGYASFIRSDYYYVGGFYNNLQETGIEAGDYGRWNARGGINFNNISVEVFANNITDEDALTWVDFEPGPIGYHLRPRTFGVSVGYNF